MDARGEKRRGGWAGKAAWAAVGLGVAAAVWGPALAAHERATRARFADDACQHVAPFVRAAEAEAASPRGYVDAYWKACLPAGYKALYAAAWKWGSPRGLSHGLPYVLLALFALALAAGGGTFGGAPAAWGCAWVALGSEAFFSRMVGGLPRAFAFPLVAAMAAFAVRGRIGWLVASLVAAFAFYPAVGVAGLLGLGFILLLPGENRGQAAGWSLGKRAGVLAATGGACFLLALPNFLGLRPYGEGLAPRDYAQYAEAAPGGRLSGADRADFALSPAQCVRIYAPAAFANAHSPWRKALGLVRVRNVRNGFLWLALGLVAAMLPRLLRRSAAARRLAAWTAATACAYGFSRAATPLLFMPERHVAYAVPVLAVLWVAAAAAALPGCFRKTADSVHVGGYAALGALGAGILLLGGTPRPEQGTVKLHAAPLYDYLGTLPADAFIAGWPNWMSPVPYVAGRSVLLSYETHLPYHRGYADEMRRRMRDLTAAYFATNAAPLAALRERYGTTHLVVEAAHLERQPPRHFAPFDGETRQAFAAGQAGGFETLRRRATAAYDDGARFVLDLGEIAE